MTDTPLARLRAQHRHCEPCGFKNHWFVEKEKHCHKCLNTWPCDTIAALDALQEERDEATKMAVDAVGLAARHAAARQVLHDRLDDAMVLIRQDQIATHIRHAPGTLVALNSCEHPDCAPFRAWLVGDKEAE